VLHALALALLLFSQLLPSQNSEIAATVAEVSPQDAFQHQQQGALLVDVREEDERSQGMAGAALGIAMGELQASPTTYLPDRQAPILLICRSGRRSKQVAAKLIQQGYTQVFSVAGGTLRWQEEGLPMTFPER